jgi:hypothetical protein
MTTPAEARQLGTTSSERLTAALCEKSFLQLWSYANVYRDQGKCGTGDGKELCDVLAVFGDDVLIFSDKSCQFPDTPMETAWPRWYRRAIQKSAHQLLGAERWLRTHPQRVFLDRACLQPFPIDLPPPERVRIHRILVTTGASEACRKFYGGGSGSLMLSPAAPSPLSAITDHPEPLQPFVVGCGRKEFFHILDDVALLIVLRELDTMPDLVMSTNSSRLFTLPLDDRS